MKSPDYSNALEYARSRLVGELKPYLRYHNVYHTLGEVIPASLLLADQLGVIQNDRDLLKVAAAFHDIGWIIQGEGHEMIGVEICQQELPRLGFSEADIHRISGMIMATRLPQSPQTLLEEILADADMFTLGSSDFWPRNSDLRYEMEALGNVVSDKDWYQSQLDFLEIHQYHTGAAQNDREPQKKVYIEELRFLVAQNGKFNGMLSDHAHSPDQQ